MKGGNNKPDDKNTAKSIAIAVLVAVAGGVILLSFEYQSPLFGNPNPTSVLAIGTVIALVIVLLAAAFVIQRGGIESISQVRPRNLKHFYTMKVRPIVSFELPLLALAACVFLLDTTSKQYPQNEQFWLLILVAIALLCATESVAWQPIGSVLTTLILAFIVAYCYVFQPDLNRIHWAWPVLNVSGFSKPPDAAKTTMVVVVVVLTSVGIVAGIIQQYLNNTFSDISDRFDLVTETPEIQDALRKREGEKLHKIKAGWSDFVEQFRGKNDVCHFVLQRTEPLKFSENTLFIGCRNEEQIRQIMHATTSKYDSTPALQPYIVDELQKYFDIPRLDIQCDLVVDNATPKVT